LKYENLYFILNDEFCFFIRLTYMEQVLRAYTLHKINVNFKFLTCKLFNEG